MVDSPSSQNKGDPGRERQDNAYTSAMTVFMDSQCMSRAGRTNQRNIHHELPEDLRWNYSWVVANQTLISCANISKLFLHSHAWSRPYFRKMMFKQRFSLFSNLSTCWNVHMVGESKAQWGSIASLYIYPPWKTNIAPAGWKIKFLLVKKTYFQRRLLLVSSHKSQVNPIISLRKPLRNPARLSAGHINFHGFPYLEVPHDGEPSWRTCWPHSSSPPLSLDKVPY